jgi:fibronectin-binding autotransporter adhesin
MMMMMITNRFLPAALAFLAPTMVAHADSGTWISTTTSGNWADATTTPWLDGIVAGGTGSTANFTSNITAATTVTLTANRTIGSLVFSDNGATGSAWTLQASGGAVLTLDGGTPTITTTTGAAIGAPVTAASGFTKDGAGTLTLTGTATGIAGTLVLNAGILESPVARLGSATINANSSFGAAYASGGAPFLRVTDAATATLANNIAIPAPGITAYYALQKSTVGSTLNVTGIISGGNANSVLQLDTPNGGDATTHFNLSNANSLAGQVRLNRGRLTLSDASALGSASLFLQTNANATNGNLSFSSVTSISNPVIIGTTANQWINTDAANITLSGALSSGTSGSGGFAKMGAGTLLLTGSTSAYVPGSTQIGAGTLNVSGISDASFNAGSLSGSGTIEIGTKNLIATAGTFPGLLTGTGATLTKQGTGALALTRLTPNAYTGATTINGGALSIGTGGTGANTAAVDVLGTSAVTVNTGGTLRLWIQNTNSFSFAADLTINGGTLLAEDGIYNVTSPVAVGASGGMLAANWGGKTLTLSNVVSGPGTITISDGPTSTAGTVILSGANTYGGGTTITTGTLALGNNQGAGSGNITVSDVARYGAAYVSGGAPFLRTSVTGLNIPNDIVLPSTAGYYALQSGTAAGSSVEWSGDISGGGAGVVLQLDSPNAGDATTTASLSGTNTFTGQIRLNRGRVILANTSALGTADLFLQTNGNPTSGNVDFAGVTSIGNNFIIGTTLNQWIDTETADITLSGSVSSATAGSGGFSKMGIGTLFLTGPVAGYSPNATAVANGILDLSGIDEATFNAGSLTGSGSIEFPNKTLVTTAGTFTGALTGTNGSLSKTGTGTLSLVGLNTYTGATTIEAGTLALTGSLDASAVEVKSGAALAGNGVTGSSITVRTGGHQAFALDTEPEFQLPRTNSGALVMESGTILDLTAAAAPAAGTYILATATGGITGTPAIVNLPPGVSGVVSVVGNNLQIVVAADPYGTWAGSFGLSGPQAEFEFDADDDGIDNGLEWILGGNPTSSDTSILPDVTGNDTTGLSLVFYRNPASVGIATLAVEWDVDLDAFAHTLPIGTSNVPPSGNNPTVTLNVPATDQVTVNIPAANTVGGKLFARLKATKN